MAGIHQTTAALRFFGPNLDPDEVTARLGKSPSLGVGKNGVWRTKNGTEKVARTGTWLLETADRQPGALEDQIAELLDALSDDLSIWQDLTTRFEADVFCGCFMLESNEGMELSPATMKKLGLRNLSIQFDIFDPTKVD